MTMFDAQHSKQSEHDRSQGAPVQEPSRTKRNIHHTGDLTRIPLNTQRAWGNQPPPWLRLPSPQQAPQDREPLQRAAEPTQYKENTTGLPDTLKAGVEQLSGLSMDDVQVHYNSAKPIQVQALAYTQGTEIHVGPGQEQHLAHEAWHVVQQKQGRVKPTLQAKGVAMNGKQDLEQEADTMGEKARRQENNGNVPEKAITGEIHSSLRLPLQRKMIYSQEAIDDDMQKLTVAYASKQGTKSSELINAAEPSQIPQLAQALGQQQIGYVENEPTPLAGEKLNYIVGHVVNLFANEAIWETHDPKQVATDFAQGKIESPSTLKLIACKAGQRFGPDLAAALKSKGKDVTVISSTGMVHATGAGIASYAPSVNLQEAQQKHGFTGFVATEAVEKVWKMRAQLSDNIDKYRHQMRKLDTKAAEMVLKQMKAEIATYFNEAIQLLNQAQAKSSPFATTSKEGWMASQGDTTRPVTDREAMIGVPVPPLPASMPKVYYRIEVPELAEAFQTLPLARLLNPFYIVTLYEPSFQEQSHGSSFLSSTEIVRIFDINRH